jgi:PAS domain S-box-containing protein
MQVEEVALLADGKEHIFLANKFPLVDANGKPYAVCAISVDITERKRAEDALRRSEERWSTTLRSIGDAVIATCAEGRVIFMNEVAEKLTGWPLSEAEGRDLEDIFNIVNEVTRIKPENPVAKAIRIGQAVGLANHTALISRDGTELPIEDSGAPIRDKDGQITGVVLVFHDISEKRRAERAVRESERLAMTGRMASTLAHEIHNPLDTVGNLLYLIDQNPGMPEQARELAILASEELARVTQMTRHMLSFQREAKSPAPIKIGEVLDNVIALYEQKIKAAGIKIEKQVEFEEEFIGLPGEMRQVFANLMSNAIEALGKNGKIRLHAYAGTDWRQWRRGLRVSVADNGPGIPAAIRNKIFDPFFTTKGEAGTGLGLWITSGIVENNDGMLRLRTVTKDGRSGTCFSVFFPFRE